MGRRAFSRIGLAVTLLSLPAATEAQRTESNDVTLSLTPPESLAVGDRSDLIANVHTRGRPAPLLLTPVSEGRAVEVVRGRLLRADADNPDATPLRFRIPLVARSAGTAILRVHVRTFVCPADEDDACRPETVEASVTVRVREPAS